ncbi:hypothetical protein N7449_008305 [Penicillium cf. viridicatum]|uniref:Uncharacterized protein n=1 Tax=Penicillium cf. viridicatum TaxID=2972119 RepID=A0A9W9J7W3_9EURO|nr:hypothetical protein N7449_008305 [Penicillium cf. viridicatum]
MIQERSIRSRGGTVIVNTESPLESDEVVKTAIRAFRGVHILINGAELEVQTGDFADSTDEELRGVMHSLKGGFLVAKAAWTVFRTQGFGRIVNVSSVEALHGVPQRALHCDEISSSRRYTLTLAKEGFRKNILVNLVLPWDSQETGADSPETSARLIAGLPLPQNTKAGGRWLRSDCKAALAEVERALVGRGRGIGKSEYPCGPKKVLDLLLRGLGVPGNSRDKSISFAGRVVLVTGAGLGLGRAYALHFARLGASVMVNDIADPWSVARQIQSIGGKAAGVVSLAEEGEKNVQVTIEAFGRINIVINNAGILRHKAFHNMTEAMWDPVLAVHLEGTYRTSKAAWPHFVLQKFGRIINTTSVTGLPCVWSGELCRSCE